MNLLYISHFDLRQTLMFSGSFPDEIQDAAQDFMHDYAFLEVGRVDASTEGVVQKVFKVDKYDKRDKLEELINDPARDPRERLMIFTEVGGMLVFNFINC